MEDISKASCIVFTTSAPLTLRIEKERMLNEINGYIHWKVDIQKIFYNNSKLNIINLFL